MTFFSVLFAFIVEQSRSFSLRNPIPILLQLHVKSIERYFDKSNLRGNIFFWIAIVLPWISIVSLIYFFLYKINSFLGLIWNIVIIYFTLEFRQFSKNFSDIHLSLNNADIQQAREILNKWIEIDTNNMPVIEIVRYTLINGIIKSHRHLFGILFWFTSPIGAAGAILYRISEYLARNSLLSSIVDNSVSMSFSIFANRIFFLIDWVPARLTSLSFAIVGNFEDAIYSWRNYANRWSDSNIGVLLTACSGALSTQLIRTMLFEPLSFLENIPEIDADSIKDRSNFIPVDRNKSYTTIALQAAINLVWRAVILWMALLFILTIFSCIS
ncbi:MAG: CobD/CbiB family protein [Burkholderia sp.]|nr:CobD/CbiB family protein [Burkholderia sp.]